MSTNHEQEFRAEFRQDLKDLTQENFLKKYTRDQMNEGATLMGVEDPEEPSTKADLYDTIIDEANLPDPALRGVSSVDGPVALTWAIADAMHTKAKAEGLPAPRRKDCVEAAVEAGVAFYTARTQYQCWFEHTNSGTKLMSDGNLDDLPPSLEKRLFGDEDAEQPEDAIEEVVEDATA